MPTFTMPAPANLPLHPRLELLEAWLTGKGYTLSEGTCLTYDQTTGTRALVLVTDRDPSADVATYVETLPPSPGQKARQQLAALNLAGVTTLPDLRNQLAALVAAVQTLVDGQ